MMSKHNKHHTSAHTHTLGPHACNTTQPPVAINKERTHDIRSNCGPHTPTSDTYCRPIETGPVICTTPVVVVCNYQCAHTYTDAYTHIHTYAGGHVHIHTFYRYKHSHRHDYTYTSVHMLGLARIGPTDDLHVKKPRQRGDPSTLTHESKHHDHRPLDSVETRTGSPRPLEHGHAADVAGRDKEQSRRTRLLTIAIHTLGTALRRTAQRSAAQHRPTRLNMWEGRRPARA